MLEETKLRATWTTVWANWSSSPTLERSSLSALVAPLERGRETPTFSSTAASPGTPRTGWKSLQ
eukprot:11202452-Lingulodinium_polyedra.AAC.1